MGGDVFKIIEEFFPPLKNIRTLKLDLARGVWERNGFNPPLLGPTADYMFPRISDHVQELELLATDLLELKGPIGLVDSRNLTKLKIILG